MSDPTLSPPVPPPLPRGSLPPELFRVQQGRPTEEDVFLTRLLAEQRNGTLHRSIAAAQALEGVSDDRTPTPGDVGPSGYLPGPGTDGGGGRPPRLGLGDGDGDLAGAAARLRVLAGYPTQPTGDGPPTRPPEESAVPAPPGHGVRDRERVGATSGGHSGQGARPRDPRPGLYQEPAAHLAPSTVPPAGPCFVLFKMVDSSESGFTLMNPFALRREIVAVCGDVSNAKPIRSGALLVEVRNGAQASALLGVTDLVGKQVEARLADSLNAVQGSIHSQQLTMLSNAELLEELKSQGAVMVQRLASRNLAQMGPNPTVRVNFAGTELPQAILCGYSKVKVSPWVLAIQQCRNCWGAGHGTKGCRSRYPTCGRCAQQHPTEGCQNPPLCVHCGEEHPVWDRSCRYAASMREDHKARQAEARHLHQEKGRRGPGLVSWPLEFPPLPSPHPSPWGPRAQAPPLRPTVAPRDTHHLSPPPQRRAPLLATPTNTRAEHAAHTTPTNTHTRTEHPTEAAAQTTDTSTHNTTGSSDTVSVQSRPRTPPPAPPRPVILTQHTPTRPQTPTNTINIPHKPPQAPQKHTRSRSSSSSSYRSSPSETSPAPSKGPSDPSESTPSPLHPDPPLVRSPSSSPDLSHRTRQARRTKQPQ